MESNIYVIFGIGKAGQELISVFPLQVAYIIDNDSTKWGSVYDGIEICSPERLLQDNKEKLHIFIASMYFEQIKSQLNNMGFNEGVNYSNASQYYGVFRSISAFLNSANFINNDIKSTDSLVDLLNLFSKECHKTFELNSNLIKGNERKVLFIIDKDNYTAETTNIIRQYFTEFFKIKIINYLEEIIDNDAIVLLSKKYKKLGYSKVLYLGRNSGKAKLIEKYFDSCCILNKEISISDKIQYIDFMYQIVNQLGFNFKKVSVVVPNYNYEQYLDKRLTTILEQQYPIYEIIFLDDASKDNSVMFGEYLLERNLGITKFIINETNSGSVFKQWAKGIEQSHGEHLWIAEADDYASLCMLNSLMIPFLEDEDVVLSYCDSMIVDETENWQANYSQINEQFTQEYLNTGIYDGRYFIENYLKECNSIPNASAVLINRNKIKPEYLDRINDFKSCGDWYFYVLLIAGGKAAYNSTPMNFFRRHSQSVTISSNRQQIAQERNEIMQFVNSICID